MDKVLQGYIDKLNKLNFKDMYEGDFFLTWEKTDDEIEAVFTVADASPCSVITLPVPVSLLHLLVTCLVLRFRIWTRARARSLMVRPFVRPLT